MDQRGRLTVPVWLRERSRDVLVGLDAYIERSRDVLVGLDAYIKWGHLLRFDPDEVIGWLEDYRQRRAS